MNCVRLLGELMYSILCPLLSIDLNPGEHPRSEEVANGIIIPQDLILLQERKDTHGLAEWMF